MSTPTTHRTAPLWKFAVVSPTTPEFNDLTESDVVTFIPLEDVWPTNKAEEFQMVPWEKRLNGYTPFRRGDLLLPKVTPTVTHGRTMITNTSTELGVASTEVYTVRARPGTDPRWLAYLLLGTEFLGLAGASVQGTGGLKRISTQFVESYPLPDASPDEQRSIADCLDRETAEIDAMSADLDEMEKLLQERRGAYISDRVRTALSPCNRVSLQSVASIHAGNSITTKQITNDEKYPVYGGNGIRGYTSEFNELQDRVLIGRQGALCGNVHLARGPFFASEHALVVNPHIDIDIEWLANVLHDQNLGQLSMSAAQPGITASAVGMQKINMPSIDEQRRIVDEIDRETAEVDAMLADITELRDLLTERRAAVIAAAVTGQIDIPTTKETTHA